MSNTHLLLLLQLIYAGGDVNSLLRRGLQYSQIAHLITEATENGYISEDATGVHLTESGLKEMHKKNGDNKLRDGGWISPLDEYRIEKLSEDDIYLPAWDVVLFQLGKDH